MLAEASLSSCSPTGRIQARSLSRTHDHPQVPVHVPDTELVDRRIAGQPIGECTAAFGGQLVKELVKGAKLPPGQSLDALLGSCSRMSAARRRSAL
jgi:hypothetical protein